MRLSTAERHKMKFQQVSKYTRMEQKRNEKAYQQFKHRPYLEPKMSDQEIYQHRFCEENKDRTLEELAAELHMTVQDYEYACRREMQKAALECAIRRKQQGK